MLKMVDLAKAKQTQLDSGMLISFPTTPENAKIFSKAGLRESNQTGMKIR